MPRPNTRGRNTHSVARKGLFADGVWKCNCAPRLPADRFETKKAGPNHGRWFYTCQKPQHKRCNFFLWDDEAKPREARAVLNDSRSEPVERRPDGLTDDVVYPDLDPVQSLNTVNHTSPTKPLPRNDSRDLDDDWNQNDDTVLLKLADEAMAPPSAPITPRKAIKKDYQDTPGKRNFDKMNTPSTSTGSGSDDIFTTPATNATGRGLFPTVKHGLISPFETPTPQRFHNVPSSVLDSPTKLKTPNAEDFSAELLSILREGHCMVSPATEAAITSACTRQVLKIHGMEKSRNMLRNIIKTRDGTIAELQQSRAQLESERESLRNVIRHLKEKDSGGGLMMPTSY